MGRCVIREGAIEVPLCVQNLLLTTCLSNIDMTKLMHLNSGEDSGRGVPGWPDSLPLDGNVSCVPFRLGDEVTGDELNHVGIRS